LGAVLALVEGCNEDEAVAAAAAAAARNGQPVVLLRVLPLVEGSIRRASLSGEVIEPWERMEAMERSAHAALAPVAAKVGLTRRVEVMVRFGKEREEVAAAAEAIGATRLVAAAGRQGARLARELSPRLEIPILLASVERKQSTSWRPFATDPKVAALAKVPALAGLPRSTFSRLATHFDRVSVDAGEMLFEQGRTNSGLWVILDGEVRISVGARTIRIAGPGCIVGATSMLDGRGATATATTLTPVDALVAGPADFRSIEADPEVELRLKAASRDILRAEIDALAPAS
jgi:Cyclic nucleotide-binding domain